MQENPAYACGIINEAKPKPEDTDDYILYNESEKQDKQLDTQLLLCAKGLFYTSSQFVCSQIFELCNYMTVVEVQVKFIFIDAIATFVELVMQYANERFQDINFGIEVQLPVYAWLYYYTNFQPYTVKNEVRIPHHWCNI